MGGGHATESVAGASLSDGAFVTIDTTIVAHLEKKGAIAESVTAFHALGAPDAKPLVDGVFIIRIFDERAFDGCGWAQTVLRASVQVVWFRFEIPGAKLAIAANGVSVDALDSRLLEDTVGGTIAATDTFLRIDLPDRPLGSTASCQQAHQPSPAGHCRYTSARTEEMTPGELVWAVGRRLLGHGSSLRFHHPHVPGNEIEDVNISLRIGNRVQASQSPIAGRTELTSSSVLAKQLRTGHNTVECSLL
jgi:hypothetical protein